MGAVVAGGGFVGLGSGTQSLQKSSSGLSKRRKLINGLNAPIVYGESSTETFSLWPLTLTCPIVFFGGNAFSPGI